VHEEGQVQRLVRAEGIEHGRARVRKQQHVGLVDLLEPANRRAVEHPALGEHIRVEGLSRHGEVLHGSGQVAEAHVDELHPLGLDEPQYLVAACEHELSLGAAAVLAAGALVPAPSVCHPASRQIRLLRMAAASGTRRMYSSGPAQHNLHRAPGGD